MNYYDGKQCPYINEDCRQKRRVECIFQYENCLVYQRMKILDRRKTKIGLERFIKKYPFWEVLSVRYKVCV